jgi:hypothetical protein
MYFMYSQHANCRMLQIAGYWDRQHVRQAKIEKPKKIFVVLKIPVWENKHRICFLCCPPQLQEKHLNKICVIVTVTHTLIVHC